MADYHGKKVYVLSTIGKFIRSFATGVHVLHIAACQDQLYITTNGGGQNVLVYNTNGGLIRRISVPANHARGIAVGIDGNLYVTNGKRKQVYTNTPEGRRVSVTTYNELQLASGIAMDTTGNVLIADPNKGKVEVYSPCGALIKTIRSTRHASDVEIGNDGTVLVADEATSKVFMY